MLNFTKTQLLDMTLEIQESLKNSGGAWLHTVTTHPISEFYNVGHPFLKLTKNKMFNPTYLDSKIQRVPSDFYGKNFS